MRMTIKKKILNFRKKWYSPERKDGRRPRQQWTKNRTGRTHALMPRVKWRWSRCGHLVNGTSRRPLLYGHDSTGYGTYDAERLRGSDVHSGRRAPENAGRDRDGMYAGRTATGTRAGRYRKKLFVIIWKAAAAAAYVWTGTRRDRLRHVRRRVITGRAT